MTSVAEVGMVSEKKCLFFCSPRTEPENENKLEHMELGQCRMLSNLD